MSVKEMVKNIESKIMKTDEEKNNAIEINTENDLKPLEIIKKKKVLSAKQLEVLANARAKLKANNHERVTKKHLEAEEIENEIQSRFSQYKTDSKQR